MPSKKITYDAQLRETEHGSRLYEYWKRVKRDTDSPEFETFTGFFKWAQEAGYSLGAKLLRRDGREPYNPDNCVWVYHEEKPKEERDPEREALWDKTVNRIRLHFGMEPIGTWEE